MKHLFLTIFFVFITALNIGQAQEMTDFYEFSESSEAYEPLTGAEEREIKPLTYFTFPIPFDFEFAGKQVAPYFKFNNTGYINLEFTARGTSNTLDTAIGVGTGILAPLWDNHFISNISESKANFLTEGVEPNRTFTIEYENLPWGKESDVIINFRIILYEGSNNIKFLYGPKTGSVDMDGDATIGINSDFGESPKFISITPGAPTMTSTTDSNNAVNYSEYPGEGTSYLFTYTPPSCKIPTSIKNKRSATTDSSFELSWIPGGDETSWELDVINSESIETYIVDSLPYIVNELSENTEYKFRIRAICSQNEKSYYSPTYEFTTLESCPKPTGINVTNIQLNQADISWTSDASVTKWEIAIGDRYGSEIPEEGVIVSSKNYTATNLEKDKDYLVYVRAICEDDNKKSSWGTRVFSTLATCNPPTDIVISDINCDSALISWLANNEENEWEIRLSRFDSDPIFISTTTNPTTITGFETNKNYFLTIKAVCSTDDSSRSSRSVAFQSIDSENPSVFCVDPFSIELDESGSATITVDDIKMEDAEDNCGISTYSLSKTNFTENDLGENNITITVSDTGGNTSECSTIVTVTSPPVSANDYVTEISNPRGLALDDNGTLYISEAFTGNVFTSNAAEEKTLFVNSGGYINNIIFESGSNNLLLAQNFFSEIISVNPNRDLSSYAKEGIDNPWGFVYNSAKELVFSNGGGKIYVLNANKKVSIYAEGFLSAEGIDFDDQGNLYVADRNNGTLSKVDPNGVKTDLVTGVFDIRAVVVVGNEVFYNGRFGFNEYKIMKYNKLDESIIEVVSKGLTSINEMIFNSNGDLFVAQDDKVSVISGLIDPQILSIPNQRTSQFTFSPNPVIDRISFNENISNLTIFTLTGQIVKKFNKTANSFQLSDLEKGVYFMQIEKDGKQKLQKIIKR